MKKLLLCLSMFAAVTTVNAQNIYNYGFTTGTAGLTTDGWQRTNQSAPATTVLWAVPTAAPTTTFAGGAQSLPAISFAVVNFTSVGTLTATGSSGAGDISNWLISPVISVKNGDVVTFYSRLGQNASSTGTEYPDRLQLRMSTDGPLTTNPSTGATDIGSFATLLVDVNPTLTTGVYPRTWTQYSYTVTGLPTPTDVKFGFRYFVTDGGFDGANSNVIGIDTFSVDTPQVFVTDTFSSINFKSFPNPVKDILNLSYDKNITAVAVINLLGQEVLSTKSNSTDVKVDMSVLNAAIYMVKISSDNEVKTIKVIKD